MNVPKTQIAAHPQRFMAEPDWARRTAAPMRKLISGPAEPSWPELEAIARDLMVSDPLGAQLADAVTGKHVSMSQFKRALAGGAAAVTEPPPVLVAFFAELEATPSWVDQALLQHGARVMRRAGLNTSDVMNAALLSGYRSSADSQLLVLTGGLTGEGTLRRLGETATWWHECIQAGGMDRASAGWRLTVHVRLMHALVNRHYESSATWDSQAWGLPINQADQGATLGLFCTYYLMAIRSFGVLVSKADGAAVMHLWRYIGWLMGVTEERLPLSEQDGRRKFYHLSLTVPPPDDKSIALARALVDSRTQLRFGKGQSWRRRYEYQKLRSIASVLVGRRGMREMGLRPTFPWYHAVRVPMNLAKHRLGRRFAPVERWLHARGERELQRGLQKHFGTEPAEVGPHRHL